MARTARNALAFVIALAAVLSAVSAFFHYQHLLSEPRQMAISLAKISPSLFVTLGQPLAFGRFPVEKLQSASGQRNAHLTFSVSGPLGSGTLVEWAQQSGSQWRLCSLVFHPDFGSRTFDLVDTERSGCAPQ